MEWLTATVAERMVQTPRATSLHLDIPGWPIHRAGQHVDVRLTADDGYTAQRSYSIASAPGTARVELAVVRVEDGEVSPYLVGDAAVGDRFEVRGPIGGWFVWDSDDAVPVLLVGGGSGVVPLVAMLRRHARSASPAAMHLVYSARSLDEVLFRDELAVLASGRRRALTLTLTREPASTWTGRRGRVDGDLLGEVAWPRTSRARTFVCGPTPFVEAVANALVALGHEPTQIRTERFGPTGG